MRHIEQVAATVDRDRLVQQMHWGGGTPNYFSFDQVERLWHCLQERFTFAADAEISIEVNPPTGYFDRWTLCFCSCHS
jgi:oxygen-independent coproporphyrinogen-3 oxidase